MIPRVFALAVLFVAHGTVLAQTAPPLVRVIVLDTSGSMDGQRIATAKAEILALAKQLPPSRDRPIILVPFHQVPHSVGTFTDLPSFEGHLQKISAGGGTSIASGLNRAVEDLKSLAKAGYLCLLLYTDDDDADRAGIAAAEKQLDSLFAARSQQGLQSLVFCKRWANANTSLLTNLAKSGNVRVIDAGDLKVVPVTLTPTVKVLRATWANTTPFTLELECQAQMELSGIPFDTSFPTAALQCTNPSAILKPVALRPGDPTPTTFTMELSLSAAAAAAAGKITLHFIVGTTGQLTLKNGVALPQLAVDQLEITVDLPPLQFDGKLSATLTASKPPTWSDPLKGNPVQHLTLTCTVEATPDLPWPQPLTVRMKPRDCQLVAGNDTLVFDGPGTLSLPVSLAANSVSAGASSFPVSLLIQPEPPAGFTLDPPELQLANDCAFPLTVETTITAQVRAISEATWSDLAQGLASFNADVIFEVAGPIPPGTQLVLLCPPAVRHIQVVPPFLHTGTQTVRIALQAQFPAAPKVALFEIEVQPPAATGAVRFTSPPPLKLQVATPAPLQLVLLGSTGGNPHVRVYDRSAPVLLTGTPMLISHGQPHKTSGITAVVRTGPLLGSQNSGSAPVEAPLMIQLQLPVTENSFFFDTTVEEDIEVLPEQSSPALVGSRQSCIVTLEAPFKRVLFYVVAVLAVIIILFLLGRLILPLVTSDRYSNESALETTEALKGDLRQCASS